MCWSVGVKHFSLEIMRFVHFYRNYDNRVSCFVCVLYLFMHAHLGFKMIVELSRLYFTWAVMGFSF